MFKRLVISNTPEKFLIKAVYIYLLDYSILREI